MKLEEGVVPLPSIGRSQNGKLQVERNGLRKSFDRQTVEAESRLVESATSDPLSFYTVNSEHDGRFFFLAEVINGQVLDVRLGASAKHQNCRKRARDTGAPPSR